MALDRMDTGTGSQTTRLHKYIGSWSVDETAAAAGAIVNFRDGFTRLTAPTAADGAAGNSTAGLHMYAWTIVTTDGESTLGQWTAAGYTAAASKIVNVTVPLVGRFATAGTHDGAFVGGNTVIGRNLYATKAGAPATAVVPTNAQWFLVAATPSTTLTSANNNLDLSSSTSIVLTDATGFAASGVVAVATTFGTFPAAYTAVSTNTLTGVTSPAPFGALMATAGAVTQPLVPDNTTATYALNIADGSFPATHPPTKSTAGGILVTARPNASGSMGDQFGNPIALQNGGQVTVEVNTGTVRWIVRGQ